MSPPNGLRRSIACAVLLLWPSLGLAVDLDTLKREAVTVGPGIDPPKVERQLYLEGPDSPSGQVTVKALIDAEGEVREVEILESSGSTVSKLARESMMSRRYAPAKKDGRPVAVWWTTTLRFHSAKEQVDATLKCDAGSPDDSPTLEISDRMERPLLVRRFEPEVSSKLHRRGSGGVTLRCRIDKCGRVSSCDAVETSGPEYTEAATRAVLQWLYRPAMLDGKPVAIHYMVRVKFDIR